MTRYMDFQFEFSFEKANITVSSTLIARAYPVLGLSKFEYVSILEQKVPLSLTSEARRKT
jgi:hypothetical protein